MMRKARPLRIAVAAAFATALVVSGATTTAVADTATRAASGVRDVDWRSATLSLPQVGSCPAQTVDFTDGAARTANSVYRFTPDREIIYADVTGEGVEDALIFMDCGPPASEYSTSLIAMTTDDTGAVRALGAVVNTGVWTQQPTDASVWYGDVAVAITDIETGDVSTRYYRWAASAQAFVRIDGR